MIRVLIIDDEYLIRKLIINSVDWVNLGFDIIGEAKDGEEALEKIEEARPELVIVDINIPFINGVELSKLIHERYPDIKSIIVTGYGEFEYARQAIEAGVLSYVVKPIIIEEFTQVLLNAKKEILNIMSRKKYIGQLEKEVQSSLEIYREKVLNSILNHVESEAKIRRKMESLGMTINPWNIRVITIEIDRLKQKFDTDNEKQLWRFAVYNISSEILEEYSNSVVFYGPEYRIVCVLNENDTSKMLNNSPLYRSFISIKDLIKQYFDFTVTIGIGECCDYYKNIKMSYEQSLAALESKFFYGNDRLITYSADDTFSWGNSQPIEDTANIMLMLRIGDESKITEFISNFFHNVHQGRLSKSCINYLAVELLNTASKFLAENNLELSEIFGRDIDFTELIKQQETIIDLKHWITSTFKDVLELVRKNKRSKTFRIVDKAKRYIEANYVNEELSLEEIAANVYVNPSYLSKIFKKELRCSIIEYLIELRIGKAKDIMDISPVIQIADIAKRVGYTDPFYFSKSFKKVFGISPSKYLEGKNR